jgi:hypothetical protein
MMLSHALWWHSHVQSIIDSDPNRVDKDWNWPIYFSFTAVVGKALSRKPFGYVIGMVTENDKHLIPCAMVILLGRFPALDKEKTYGVFTWFLSTAPAEALPTIKEYKLTRDTLPKQLGAICMDTAITHSVNNRTKGRVAAYAMSQPLSHFTKGKYVGEIKGFSNARMVVIFRDIKGKIVDACL